VAAALRYGAAIRLTKQLDAVLSAVDVSPLEAPMTPFTEN
jgi:hypothetical protein